jgi:hypothetical protein
MGVGGWPQDGTKLGFLQPRFVRCERKGAGHRRRIRWDAHCAPPGEPSWTFAAGPQTLLDTALDAHCAPPDDTDAIIQFLALCSTRDHHCRNLMRSSLTRPLLMQLTDAIVPAANFADAVIARECVCEQAYLPKISSFQCLFRGLSPAVVARDVCVSESAMLPASIRQGRKGLKEAECRSLPHSRVPVLRIATQQPTSRRTRP